MTTIADSLNDLEIHHLSICTKDSTPEERLMRGVIKCGETIVCKSFGHTPEIVHTDSAEVQAMIQPLIEQKIRAFKSFEGSILRIWCWNGEWHLSTFRKIDAFKSRWGTQKSYGEMFIDALISHKAEYQGLADCEDASFFTDYCKKLNPDYTYVFLMRSGKDSKLVCNAFTAPQVFIVGAFDRSKDFAYVPGRNCTECVVPSSVEVEVNSVDDCVNIVANLNVREYQGLIFISDEGKAVKLVNETYYKMLNLRDNVPNVFVRYVQLKQNASKDLDLFLNVYQEKQEEFANFDLVLSDISKNIHKKYLQRYIQGKVVVVPNDQFYIMKELHQKHIADRSYKVTEPAVVSYVAGLKAISQVQLYESYCKRKTELGNGNFVPEEMRQKIFAQLHDWSEPKSLIDIAQKKRTQPNKNRPPRQNKN